MKLAINGDTAQFIHSDDLIGLSDALGSATTKRVSDVEPDEDGNWVADMNKMGENVQLGPFVKRGDALAAEVDFVEERLGVIKCKSD